MTFWVFLLNSLPPSPITFFFFFLLPTMTSKPLRSQVCLSGGVCVVTLASFSRFLCSQLNTTLPSSKWCLQRRAGECDPLWENDVNHHSKDLNQKRDGWKVRSREHRAERQAVRGCKENWAGYEDSIGSRGQRKGKLPQASPFLLCLLSWNVWMFRIAQILKTAIIFKSYRIHSIDHYRQMLLEVVKMLFFPQMWQKTSVHLVSSSFQLSLQCHLYPESFIFYFYFLQIYDHRPSRRQVRAEILHPCLPGLFSRLLSDTSKFPWRSLADRLLLGSFKFALSCLHL